MKMIKGANTKNLEKIYESIQPLPVSDRIKLVKRLLAESGLSVVLDNNGSEDNPVIQVNTMDPTQIADVMRAIANRIESE